MEYAVEIYLRSRGIKEPARVIHRLDKGTSGVMFFPKGRRPATHISYLLKTGGVEKVYWALVAAEPDEEEWTVDAPIAKLNKFRYGVALPGKEARTMFRVLARGAGATLVEARPLTGRTHQIRVHLVHSGFPIIGDTTYGGDAAPRMMLHCRSMAFQTRDGRPVAATAPADREFAHVCAAFGIDVSRRDKRHPSQPRPLRSTPPLRTLTGCGPKSMQCPARLGRSGCFRQVSACRSGFTSTPETTTAVPGNFR